MKHDLLHLVQMLPAEPHLGSTERPVLPWRWIAGGLLHFAIAAYLLIVLLGCLLFAPAHSTAEELARLALKLSLWFLAGLVVTMALTMPAAAILNRAVIARRRRRALGRSSPASVLSRERVERATRSSLDGTSAEIIARIATARWDHEDVRYQALARDLDEVVRAGAAALASAEPERRPAIIATVAQTLVRIADELDTLFAAKARADEAQVQLLSNYVQTRYSAPDSPFGLD